MRRVLKALIPLLFSFFIIFLVLRSLFMGGEENEELKVVVMYQDFSGPPEGLEKSMEILKELSPDMVWYSKQILGAPPPKDLNSAKEILNSLNIPEKFKEKIVSWISSHGYTLEEISKEAKECPGIYCPCVLVQNLRVDFNYDPLNFTPIPRKTLLGWELNFSKFGLPYDLEKTQEIMRNLAGLPKGAAFPDITNPGYQSYLLRKIEALKKAGVREVWLDMLFTQALIAYRITGNFSSEAVKEAYLAACKLTYEISKLGVKVGTWANWVIFPYKEKPKVDFLTLKISTKEVLSGSPDLEKWKEEMQEIRNKTKVPVLMVLDFGPSDNSPLAVFSQKLSPEEQRDFLRNMTKVAEAVGAIPVFPVKGGSLGKHPKKLAYGKYNFYDAMAPQFGTFEEIKKLISEIRGQQSETSSSLLAQITSYSSLRSRIEFSI